MRTLETYSVKVYDGEDRGPDGRAQAIYRGKAIGMNDLRVVVMEATHLLNERKDRFLVVRLEGRYLAGVEQVISEMIPEKPQELNAPQLQ